MTPKMVLAFSIHAGLVIFEPVNQFQLTRSTYKVTNYVDFTPYQTSSSKFETYLVNVANNFNYLDILAHFQKQIQPVLFGGKYDFLEISKLLQLFKSLSM